MQVLSPGVQDGDQPDLGAEMPGIGSDDAQRLGGGGEQDAIDDGLIVESDLGDRRRHREDDVEVRHRQQLGLSVGQPLGTRQCRALRAVPVAAGIVGDAELAAVVALFDMTAQRCRAAGFDGTHNTALAAAQMAGMSLSVSGAVAAEDIRHLQSAAHASLSGERCHREMQAIERAGGAGDDIGRHAGIDRRRRQPAAKNSGGITPGTMPIPRDRRAAGLWQESLDCRHRFRGDPTTPSRRKRPSWDQQGVLLAFASSRAGAGRAE